MSSLTPFCPRCGGKMQAMRDLYGEYHDCLNCGYHLDTLKGPPIDLKATGTRAKQARRPSKRGRSL